MEKSKHKANDFHIETVFDPYTENENDTFTEIYQRYLEDDEKAIEKDGLLFYKALQITKLFIHNKTSLEVVLPREIEPCKDCTIIDENGNRYEYNGTAMLNFKGEIPEWNSKIVFAILSLPEKNGGKYFAKLK